MHPRLSQTAVVPSSIEVDVRRRPLVLLGAFSVPSAGSFPYAVDGTADSMKLIFPVLVSRGYVLLLGGSYADSSVLLVFTAIAVTGHPE